MHIVYAYIQYPNGSDCEGPDPGMRERVRTRPSRRLNTSWEPCRNPTGRLVGTGFSRPSPDGAIRPPARPSMPRSPSSAVKGWWRKAAKGLSGSRRPPRSCSRRFGRGSICNGTPGASHRLVRGCSRKSPSSGAESGSGFRVDCQTRSLPSLNPARGLPSWRSREAGSYPEGTEG